VQTARKKSPATAERIISMALGTGDGLKGVRDRALLLLGFAGAFRRSESLPLSPRENHAPRLGDPNPCDFECAAASDHAFRLCCRQPRTDQFVQLSNREAVHQHDRFGAAVGARGKEFQRAPAVGLGAAPGGVELASYLPLDQALPDRIRCADRWLPATASQKNWMPKRGVCPVVGVLLAAMARSGRP
jgi:hypothetical protein